MDTNKGVWENADTTDAEKATLMLRKICFDNKRNVIKQLRDCSSITLAIQSVSGGSVYDDIADTGRKVQNFGKPADVILEHSLNS